MVQSVAEPIADPDATISLPSTTDGPEPQKRDFYMKTSTESSLHQHLDEDEIPLDINPAYPSLPADDFSIRGDNNYQISDNDDIGDEPRSIGGHHSIHAIMHAGHHEVATKNSKHLDDMSFGSGSGSGGGSGMGDMIVEELVAMPSAPEGSGGLDLQQKSMDNYEIRIKKKKPEIIQFLYSAEDSSEETRITNSSDFQAADSMKKSEDSSLESTEILKPLDSLMTAEFGSGSGSGAGEIKQEKERDPTTPRPKKALASVDIDELHDSSGNGPEEDPKDDAESLKLDDSASDTTANSDKSPKGNILSVKVQQDKALHDDLV